MRATTLAPLVGDLRQLASVRRIVLDDGPETGVRALLFSTGGGLDFMVLVDRSLDIGTLHFGGLPLDWQSAAGFRSPHLTHPDAEGGRGFNRSFSGLLMTGGLDHIRQPRDGAPLHGRLPNTPARLLAYGETWDRPEPVLFCEGEVIQATYGRESLRLRRRIEAPIGGTTLRIADTVENCGTDPWPQAMLYHINLGYPGIATGSTVELDGVPIGVPLKLDDRDAKPEVTCLPAGPGDTAVSTLRTETPAGTRTLSVAFGAQSLPYLQVWKDLRLRVGVLAIEPCTSARRPDGTSEPEAVLQPGECRRYAVEIGITGAAAWPAASSGG